MQNLPSLDPSKQKSLPSPKVCTFEIKAPITPSRPTHTGDDIAKSETPNIRQNN